VGVLKFACAPRATQCGAKTNTDAPLLAAGITPFLTAINNKVRLLGFIYFCVASSIYIISFWLPTIVKQTGVSDPFRIGLLTAIPYTAAIIAMIAVNTNSDRLRERR
jgi:hypothetical protein